jgi:hypothetical protein
VEPGANLEQRSDAAVDIRPSAGRLGDAGENLEERALAGSVAADETDHFAGSDLERRLAQRPQFGVVWCSGTFGQEPARAAHRRGAEIDKALAKRLLPYAELVLLSQPLGVYRNLTHLTIPHTTSANVRSIRRK